MENRWYTPCDNHFQMQGHNFDAHVTFTIPEQVINKYIDNPQPVNKIFGFGNLSPQGVNMSLNYPQEGTIASIW